MSVQRKRETPHTPPKSDLKNIPVDSIRPNPENPRLKFRPGELEELQESIRRHGIQVPISVFRKGNNFIIIDGERRWRCATKLNLRSIPAIIRDAPDPLQNIVLMFNIHMLREQWDLLTIALKLPRVIELYEKKHKKSPTESDLSQETGLKRGVIRKCRFLSDLPDKYKELLLTELDKPKGKQEVGEEFFVEMEKSLATVRKNYPDLVSDVDKARDTLLRKYREGLIDSNIEFRKLSKIARARNVGADQESAEQAIQRVFDEPKYSIDQAWTETVSEAYAERDVISRIDSLISKIDDLTVEDIDEDVRSKLAELAERIKAVLEASE